MTITANSGPFIAFGLTQGSTGQVQQYNEDRGPSLFDLGSGMEDPRYQFDYEPGSWIGNSSIPRVYGLYANQAFVDYVPATINTSAFQTSSASGALVAGSAITLAPSSANGTYTTTIIAPETGGAVTTIALDSTAQYLSFGSAGTIATWNPAAGTGRAITLTPAGNSSLDGGSWFLAGRDMYGFKITESVSVSSQVMTSRKTYKYLTTVLAATTLGSTGVGIGFNDTYGLPLLAKNTGLNVQIKVIATASLQYANSSGPITLGSTATQTATSIDPRGTYASTTASNGTVRLQIVMPITANMAAAATATDVSLMFGAAQFSSV